MKMKTEAWVKTVWRCSWVLEKKIRNSWHETKKKLRKQCHYTPRREIKGEMKGSQTHEVHVEKEYCLK